MNSNLKSEGVILILNPAAGPQFRDGYSFYVGEEYLDSFRSIVKKSNQILSVLEGANESTLTRQEQAKVSQWADRVRDLSLQCQSSLSKHDWTQYDPVVVHQRVMGLLRDVEAEVSESGRL